MEGDLQLNIHLQEATVEDIPRLIEIEKKLANLRIYSAMTSEKEWKKEMNKSNAKVYLILKDNAVVGNTSYEKKDDGSVYISGLAIDPPFQKMGIGRKVIKMILEKLKDAKTIKLVTHPDNEAAIKLYTSFGFIVKERKENYYGDEEPRLILVLQNYD